MSKNKVLLMILDGFGLNACSENNAAVQADTPYIDELMKTCPMAKLACSGRAVGLPDGVMGNSEVGHLNIGAGRVVMQNLVRIDVAVENDQVKTIPEFKEMVDYSLKNDKPVHLMGLMSDAGVHSHEAHLRHVISTLKATGVKKVYVHAFMDGRDTPPNSGIGYISRLQTFLDQEKFGKIATLIGRFYVMDRDKRWDRVERAYNTLVGGEGIFNSDAVAAVQEQYDRKITDEFIEPVIADKDGLISEGDAVLVMNYRADRVRELSEVLNDGSFGEFKTKKLNLHYVTMTQYQADFPYPILFKPQKLDHILGEEISQAGMTQLRIAETEKYAHVTYFFNGGEEKQFEGEDRILVPSPKVATYDLQPEMSAPEVTEKLLAAIEDDKYDVIILNFANGDMVGHTGMLDAAVQAVEYLDTAVKRIVKSFVNKGGTAFITADHGNCEQMWDEKNQQPHTQHTLNRVPFIMVSPDCVNKKLIKEGKLADIAPTILNKAGLKVPDEMTGNSMI